MSVSEIQTSKQIITAHCSRAPARAINNTSAGETRAELRNEPEAGRSASRDWGRVRKASPEEVEPGTSFEA